MINKYSLLRADHPRNTELQGVCLYFNVHLLLIRRNDLRFLQGCSVTKIIVHNGKNFSHAFIDTQIRVIRN